MRIIVWYGVFYGGGEKLFMMDKYRELFLALYSSTMPCEKCPISQCGIWDMVDTSIYNHADRCRERIEEWLNA